MIWPRKPIESEGSIPEEAPRTQNSNLRMGQLVMPCQVICIAQTSFAPRSILGPIRRNQDYVSMNFEQWQQLSALASKEQDPAKLTDLARKLNLVLNQRTQTLDSLPRKPSE
jgi:hypothetical protein